MSAALVAAVVLIAVTGAGMAMTWRRRWPEQGRARSEETIRHIRQTKAVLEATERRALERTSRADPTDDERIERLRIDVEIRTRDHGP